MDAANRNEPRPKKRGRPFEPGNKANLSGRPKEYPHVKELARVHTVEAIETLASIMRDDDSSRARVAAAQVLLDRAWGKPEQSISGTIEGVVKLVMGSDDLRVL